jgi:ferritin-like metal-binding protein YciE
VFKKLGQKPSGTNCPAIDGLIKEADETSGEIDDKSVLDAAILANAPPMSKSSASGSDF